MKAILNFLKLLIVIVVIANQFFLLYFYLKIKNLEKEIKNSHVTTVIKETSEGTPIDLSSYATKSYVLSLVKTTATPSPTAKPLPQATASPAKKVSIIPISATFETQSLSWVDVPGSDFYLDLENDYGGGATLYWEAFLREQHGNGNAEARILDVTHGIVVPGSEISTNKPTSTLITSSNLAIWRGKNLYRVQVKSQKGFVVYFSSGRIKITS